jgi:hypothetical protein
MTNLRKNLLVAGCVCLSFTLFSFTSTNVTESKIGDASVSYQSVSNSPVGGNPAAKTGKLLMKVWRNTCAQAAAEVLEWAMGNVTNNTPNSELASVKEMNYKLNQL